MAWTFFKPSLAWLRPLLVVGAIVTIAGGSTATELPSESEKDRRALSALVSEALTLQDEGLRAGLPHLNSGRQPLERAIEPEKRGVNQGENRKRWLKIRQNLASLVRRQIMRPSPLTFIYGGALEGDADLPANGPDLRVFPLSLIFPLIHSTPMFDTSPWGLVMIDRLHVDNETGTKVKQIRLHRVGIFPSLSETVQEAVAQTGLYPRPRSATEPIPGTLFAYGEGSAPRAHLSLDTKRGDLNLYLHDARGELEGESLRVPTFHRALRLLLGLPRLLPPDGFSYPLADFLDGVRQELLSTPQWEPFTSLQDHWARAQLRVSITSLVGDLSPGVDELRAFVNEENGAAIRAVAQEVMDALKPQDPLEPRYGSRSLLLLLAQLERELVTALHKLVEKTQDASSSKMSGRDRSTAGRIEPAARIRVWTTHLYSLFAQEGRETFLLEDVLRNTVLEAPSLRTLVGRLNELKTLEPERTAAIILYWLKGLVTAHARLHDVASNLSLEMLYAETAAGKGVQLGVPRNLFEQLDERNRRLVVLSETGYLTPEVAQRMLTRSFLFRTIAAR